MSAPMANLVVPELPISPASLKESALASLLTIDKCSEYMLNFVNGSSSVDLFSSLLNELCFEAYNCKNEANFNHEEFAHLSANILNIWLAAPYELKMKYFQNSDHLDRLFLRFKYALGTEMTNACWQPRLCYKHDVSFFLQLFLDMPLELRPTIWHDYWLLLVARFRPDDLTHLLSLCLIDQNEIRTFVVIEMFDFVKIAPIVGSWWNRRMFYDVINYSNLCTWDTKLVREFRRNVFSVLIPSLETDDYDKFMEVIELIRNPSENNESSALQSAISNNAYNIFQQNFLIEKLEQGFSEALFWLMERFTPTKRSPREMKTLLSHWHDFLIIKLNDQDHAARWKEFSSWWDSEANDCPMFKQFLCVDEMFKKLLLQIVQNLIVWLGPTEMDRAEVVPSQSHNIRMEEFELIDEFLTWYHGTETAAKDYKWSKLLNFEEIPWLADLLYANNECLVNDLLRWFFNGDLVEIDYFKNNVINKIDRNPEISLVVID